VNAKIGLDRVKKLGAVIPVVRYAEAEIPTLHGQARVIVFREAGDPAREHVALVYGTPFENPDDVLIRVHSECLTAEVFGSLKCDCKEQLEGATLRVRQAGSGVIIYLRQEGRGIGLGNKIRAYALQSRGLDTIQANHQLGFGTDLRTYDIAAAMLGDLGVRGVSLMTNNPDKVDGLERCGIRVNRRLPLEVEPTSHNKRYLTTKRQQLGHLLELVAKD
jgi:GTP cyclohydrolase II/3,4-dihydroxy 2-butanone 4-phosphate synthase/GTP cyclohydrolase II